MFIFLQYISPYEKGIFRQSTIKLLNIHLHMLKVVMFHKDHSNLHSQLRTFCASNSKFQSTQYSQFNLRDKKWTISDEDEPEAVIG